jgi:TolA-binding protein
LDESNQARTARIFINKGRRAVLEGDPQMSLTPASMPEGDPQTGSVPSTFASSTPLWAVLVLAVVSVAGMGGLYYHARGLSSQIDQVNGELRKAQEAQTSEAEALQQIAGRLDQADARDAELQGQVAQTQTRLGSAQSELQRTRQQTTQATQAAAELARQQKAAQEAAQQLASQLGQLQQEQVATKGNVGSLTTDVAGVRGDVKSTKDDLAATRSELQRVIGDLGVQSDLVAHNRTELEELKLRGERDYVEFNLRRSDRIQRVGSVRLELRRTDPKRQKYTVNLVVDDQTIEKKDKNVYEPVQFYLEGFRTPTEIVVNKIERDRITGYISSPKKKEDRPPMQRS